MLPNPFYYSEGSHETIVNDHTVGLVLDQCKKLKKENEMLKTQIAQQTTSLRKLESYLTKKESEKKQLNKINGLIRAVCKPIFMTEI